MAIAQPRLLGGGAAPQGPSRFEPQRDLRPVVDLLRLGFGADLEPRDLQWLDDLGAVSPAGLALHRLIGAIPGAGEAWGYVYYDQGQLVGNASLFRCSPDVWVLANVVTHPAWRRRGVGRAILECVLRDLRGMRAQQLQLQVRSDNAPAQRLYAGMGFWQMNTVAALRLPLTAAVRHAGLDLPPGVRLAGYDRLRDRSALEAHLQRHGHLDRGGPTSLLVETLEHGLMGAVDDWLQGRSRRTWLARDGGTGDGEPVAVATLLVQRRRGTHRLGLSVAPPWQGRLEAPLIDVVLDTLRRAPLSPVEAEVEAGQAACIGALEWAGFERLRTLDRLALDL